MVRRPTAIPEKDPHSQPLHTVRFRFYRSLNDFLPVGKRQRALDHLFGGTPSVKDTIEAIGIPHTEVDVILVDGESVGFDRRLKGGEKVGVYPAFEDIDVSPLRRLCPRIPEPRRFAVDVHLGALARNLRLLGFDTLWRNDLDDRAIIDSAEKENRIILTRDLGILRHGRVIHGYWLRATEPLAQIEEVVRVFDLAPRIRPYTRCTRCNELLRPISEQEAFAIVPERVAAHYHDFTRCDGCGRVYWAGSHQPGLERIVQAARAAGRR